jgi:signal transduction histidine kinase
LTDFAKLQNTEIKLKVRVVDMNKIIERANLLVSGLLQTRNQSLNCELDRSGRLIKADPDRVIQILLNLLTNASKYGQPYKEIGIKTYPKDGYLVTEIKDTAASLEGDDKEFLFKPYKLARQRGSGGLGLGLYICKQLVELHGGKIWLEAEVSGNMFKFSLPLSNEMENDK